MTYPVSDLALLPYGTGYNGLGRQQRRKARKQPNGSAGQTRRLNPWKRIASQPSLWEWRCWATTPPCRPTPRWTGFVRGTLANWNRGTPVPCSPKEVSASQPCDFWFRLSTFGSTLTFGAKPHRQIARGIVEASDGLASATGKPWGLSRDHRYQLSNRFAWSWKLASLGMPVVLLYLGFLNAQDMADDGPLFRSEGEWTRVLRDHSRGAVDETCWGEWLDIAGTPLIPLIRGIDQPFDPDTEEAGI